MAVQFHQNENDTEPAWVKRLKHIMMSEVKGGADLAKDYPRLDLERWFSFLQPGATTAGIIIHGKHYRLSCATRFGDYPFCSQLALPSYSTAKSLFAGVALLHLEKRVPTISQVKVAKYLPECKLAQWQDVTLADLLNMRTGNFLTKKSHADESSTRMIQFLTSMTHAEKIEMACHMFPRRSKPGKYFVYHSSDTYLAGVVMSRLFRKLSDKADLYHDLMLKSLWANLNLSPLLDDSKRTYDQVAQTYTGWGLTYTIDDLIKLNRFIFSQGKQTDSVFSQAMFAMALQQSGNQFNLQTENPSLAYNFGFWSLEVSSSLDCERKKWIPFMSGYGGITVVMVSPEIMFYNFSDNYRHEWLPVVTSINRHFPLCDS